MGNYVNVAVVLKTKKDFDIAWQIASDSDIVESLFAQITGNYIVNFDIKYDMDWNIIRQISKSVEEQVKVFTHYDDDGTMEMAAYTAGKRDSKKSLDAYDADYWFGLICVFGNVDWCLPLGEHKELVIKGSYKYSFLTSVYVVDYENGTFEQEGGFKHMIELPEVVKKYEKTCPVVG